MRRACLIAVAVAATACQADDAARARALASMPARQLVGVWTARFHLIVPALFARADTADVTGTLSLIEDAYGQSTPRFAGALHVGTYVANFSRFGFDLRERGVVPVALARVDGDSVTITFDPADARTFTLRGVIAGDSVSGIWSYSSRAAGARGTFVMHRYYSTIVSGIGLSR